MIDQNAAAETGLVLEAVSTIFASIGRGLVCLDRAFRVVHASPSLDGLVAPGAAAALPGRPVEEVLGAELFGPDGPVRRALAKGERREAAGC